MLSINKKTVAWGLIYWIVLNISYMWALQNHFANSFPRDFDLLRFCIITPVLFTLLNAIPKEKDAGIVSFYLIVLIYMVYIPLAVVFVQQSSNYLYIIAVSIVFYFVEKLSGRIKIYHVSASLHYSMSVSKLILCFLILLTAAAVAALIRPSASILITSIVGGRVFSFSNFFIFPQRLLSRTLSR